METAIGVFTTRESAEHAVTSLIAQEIPRESIIYLTLSEAEADSMGKKLGAYAGGLLGGATGFTAGIAAATMFALPGVGPVFALGAGAAALLGFAGAGTGAAVGGRKAEDPNAPAPSIGPEASEDAQLFRRVLSEGHSLVVVRVENPDVAAICCRTLDQLGISMPTSAAQKARVNSRELGGAVIIDVMGKIALTDGTMLIRDTVQRLLQQGKRRILLNLKDVDFVDSAGLGELVRTHASVSKLGGQLKILSPNKNVHALLHMTKLDQVLEIQANEAVALQSFESGSPSSKAAS